MTEINLRTMVLLGKRPNDNLFEECQSGAASVPEFFAIAQTTGATIIPTEVDSLKAAGIWGAIIKSRPAVAAVFEAFQKRASFDHIYTTGEELGLLLLFALKLVGWRGKIYMVVHASSSKKRQLLFKMLGDRHVGAYICVSKTQADVLANNVGLPKRKVHFWYNWVDVEFYSSTSDERNTTGDYIFACGLENRDYATLRHAAASLPFDFRVQASGFFADHGDTGSGNNLRNFQVNRTKIPFVELRQMYAEAKFVVVPLNAVPYAAGVTGILEAMSMSKAVVVTDSPGISEYVEDGISGFVVPANDPLAMANAIERLWNSPELCARMGARNREWVQKNASVRDYAHKVKAQMLAYS